MDSRFRIFKRMRKRKQSISPFTEITGNKAGGLERNPHGKTSQTNAPEGERSLSHSFAAEPHDILNERLDIRPNGAFNN